MYLQVEQRLATLSEEQLLLKDRLFGQETAASSVTAAAAADGLCVASGTASERDGIEAFVAELSAGVSLLRSQLLQDQQQVSLLAQEQLLLKGQLLSREPPAGGVGQTRRPIQLG